MNAELIKRLGPPLLFVVYVAVSCCGLYLLKAATGWRTVTFLAGVLLYGIGAVLWLWILRLWPLSLVFPIAAGALVLGTTLIGITLLGENVTAPHLFGAALIIVGITLIASGWPTHGR